jgi:hypothetical protein
MHEYIFNMLFLAASQFALVSRVICFVLGMLRKFFLFSFIFSCAGDYIGAGSATDKNFILKLQSLIKYSLWSSVYI